MLRRTTVALVAILALTTASLAQTSPPLLDKDAARIRQKIEDLGVGHKLTVKLKNGDHYHGAISKIDMSSFEMAEVDLSQVVKFQYAEIKSLYGNYGQKNIFGNRPNPKTGMIISLGALGAVFALIVLSIPKT